MKPYDLYTRRKIKRNERNQDLKSRRTKVCQKYCSNKLHKCEIIHLKNDACPVCLQPVIVRKKCGHYGIYKCHMSLDWTALIPCEGYATSSNQNHRNQMIVPIVFFPQKIKKDLNCSNLPLYTVSAESIQQQPVQPQPIQNFVLQTGTSMANPLQETIQHFTPPKQLLQQNLNFYPTVAQNIATVMPTFADFNRNQIYQWIFELTDANTRENALSELCKHREVDNDIAELLCSSSGTINILWQEIVYAYPYIFPENLNAQQSLRVCYALALLQCVAANPKTRQMFLEAHIPFFLFPLLNTTSKKMSFEYLRLNSLTIISALIKDGKDIDIINLLVTMEMIPMCLRIMCSMQASNEYSVIVATSIFQTMILHDEGLTYLFRGNDRFSQVIHILLRMVLILVNDSCAILLKIIIRCYLRLMDNCWARERLQHDLPLPLRDCTFTTILKDDETAQHWLSQLLNIVAAAPCVPEASSSVPDTTI